MAGGRGGPTRGALGAMGPGRAAQGLLEQSFYMSGKWFRDG